MSTRLIWGALAVAAIALLAVGSVHSPPSSSSARVAYLDSILKCPSCEDLSIAQSDAPSAVALRHRVTHWVDEGWSNSRIESAVEASYGQSELLLPPGGGVNATLYIVPVALIGLAAAGVGWHLYERHKLGRSQT